MCEKTKAVQKIKKMPDNYSSRIEYSEKYSDDKYEYRYVEIFVLYEKKKHTHTHLDELLFAYIFSPTSVRVKIY